MTLLKNINNSIEKKINNIGCIYVLASKNNTLISLTDIKGKVKFNLSCGSIGFKNSRKSTSYAAQAAAETLAKKAKDLGYFYVKIKLKGLSFSKESTVRALHKFGLNILQIQDITPLAHNGCRRIKRRRI